MLRRHRSVSTPRIAIVAAMVLLAMLPSNTHAMRWSVMVDYIKSSVHRLALRSVSHSDASPRLDPTFGSAGVVQIPWFGPRSAAYAIASSPEGDRYYLAGPVTQATGAGSTGTDFGLACIDSLRGSPCPGFGIGGKVTVDFGNVNGSRTDVATAMIVQPEDGRIVVGGTANLGASATNANITFALSRHLPESGALDVHFFGTDRTTHAYTGGGKVLTDVDAGVNDEIFAMLYTERGNIFATGFANPTNTSGAGPAFNIGSTLYRTDGTLATSTFGGLNGSPAGRQITNIGPNYDDRSRGAALLPHRRGYVIVGRSRSPDLPANVFFGTIVKYDAQGAVDTAFGNPNNYSNTQLYVPGALINRGAVAVQLPGGNGSTLLTSVALAPSTRETEDRNDNANDSDDNNANGRRGRRVDLIVAGSTTAWDNSTSRTTAIIVARYTDRGNVVSSWGSKRNGFTVIKVPATVDDSCESIVVDDKHTYIVGRSTLSDGSSRFLIVALHTHSGEKVTSFGSGGVMLLDLKESHGIASGYFRSALIDANSNVKENQNSKNHKQTGRYLVAAGEGNPGTAATPAVFVAVRIKL